MVSHIKELLGLLEFHPSFGHFEFGRRLGSSWASMFHVVAFSFSNSYFFRPLVKFPWRNNFRKPPVNAEFLEIVIKRRSANHSWRPSSKAAPKNGHAEEVRQTPQWTAHSYRFIDKWHRSGYFPDLRVYFRAVRNRFWVIVKLLPSILQVKKIMLPRCTW